MEGRRVPEGVFVAEKDVMFAADGVPTKRKGLLVGVNDVDGVDTLLPDKGICDTEDARISG